MKNKKALILLFLANCITSFSQGLCMFSIAWYFTDNHLSSEFLYLNAFVTITSLFWILYAGTIIDGFNRKDVFLGTNFIQGLLLLSIASLGFKEAMTPVAEVLDPTQKPTIDIFMVCAAIAFALTFYGYFIHYPNLYAFAQEISDPKDYTRITSLIEILGQSMSIGAGAVGAFLLKGVGPDQHIPFTDIALPVMEKWKLHEIFLLDAVSYFVAFIVITFIRFVPVVKMAHYDEGPLRERLKTGFDFVRKNRLISIFAICSYSIFIVLLVERLGGLMGVYVHNHLMEGVDVFGISEVMYALGSLAAGFLAGKFMTKIPIPKSIIIFILITSFSLFLSAFTSSAVIFYLVSFTLGIANAGSRIFRVTYLFMLVPNELAGRVNSVFSMITTCFRFIFQMIFGLAFFIDGNGVVYAYTILGVFTLAAGIVLIVLYKPLLALTEKITDAQQEGH